MELMPAIDFKCDKSELSTLYTKDPRFGENEPDRPISPKLQNFRWIDEFESIFIATTDSRYPIPESTRDQLNLFQLKCDISTFIDHYKLKQS